MRSAVVVWLGVVACAPKPPLRAIVEVAATNGPPRNTVLALPATCVSDEPYLCEVSGYYTDPSKAPQLTFDEIVHPLVKLKLELAGYTLVDARTLRLETAGRTDVTHDGATSTRIDEVPTVATLAYEDAFAAAASIHLGGILVSTLQARRQGYEIWLELLLELRSVPEGELQWTARCAESVDTPTEAANLVASCAGDGVLAWRAPTALIGRIQ